MKRFLAVLLALLCALLPMAVAESVIATNADDVVSLCRSAVITDTAAGSTSANIYLRQDATGALVQLMEYYQANDTCSNGLQVYRLPDNRYYAESSMTLDGTEKNYMLITPTTTGLTVSKHVYDPGYTSGSALEDSLTGTMLYEVTVNEFASGDVAQEVRNVLNTQFAADGVIFTEDGTVVNNGTLIFNMTDSALIALPETTDAPVEQLIVPAEENADETTDETTGETASSSSSSDTYITTTGSVHLRAKADKSSTSLTTVPSGKYLRYTDTSKDSRGVRWYKVKYDGYTGWVSGKYAEKGKVSGRSSSSSSSSSSGTVTTTGSVTIRKSASKNSANLGSIPSGKKVTYLGDTKTDSRGIKWYKIRYDGVTGWISSRYSVKGSASVSDKSGTVTTTGDVTIRKSASKDSASLGSIPAGKYVTYLGSSKTDSRGVKWYKIRYDGTTGWISSKYAVQGKVKTSSSSSSSSSSSYVKIVSKANIRSTYDKDSSLKGTIPAGKKVTYLGSTKKDDRGVRWYKIKYSGTTGWVSEKVADLHK